MTKIINATKSFHLKVKTLYDMEKQLEIALQKMAEAATNPELKDGFLNHLEETKMHSERLEEIFSIIEIAPEEYEGEGIRGIIAEGETIIETEAPTEVKDAMLAGVARSVEHFEIACYTTAIEEAKALGYDDVVELLTETLEEERVAERILFTALQDSLRLATVV